MLVNSERTPWLENLQTPQQPNSKVKPDLFLTYEPCWVGKVVAGAAVGQLAGRALQEDGCVIELYEVKAGAGSLSATDFGQLVDYHTHMPGLCRGALLNKRSFWLYESLDGIPVQLTQATWEARGSHALFCGFFDAARQEPPLVVVLRSLMRVLGLQSCAASGGAGGALLGVGASGRVFCVQRSATGSSAPRAGLLTLKVSCLASQGDLAMEYALMQAAAARGAPVASVVKDSLRAVALPGTEQYAGGGYLLAEVLQHVSVTSLRRCTSAFAALQALHGCGMAHGDARLPNLLARRSEAESEGDDGQLVWIDLRNAACAVWSQRADARQLAVSVLALGEEDALPGAVARALQGVPQGGAPAYAALAAAVHAALLAE